ncbi:response regulator [Allobacillus salarius]|uniref:histidine kinase n=2 Tax=Bacillaceae TaxID=186817 RepID=A0A556PGQ4_9BACI|nr:response regulator [Allobacillus salarius]
MLNFFKKMNRIKLILIAVLFLVLLSTLRIGWLALFYDDVDQPQIQKGELDLTEWDSSTEVINLDGEWKFFPNHLTTTDQVSKHFDFVQVPGEWGDHSVDENGSLPNYGTYYLKLVMDSADDKVYSISVPSVRNASKLYVNGKLLGQSGEVGDHENDYDAKNVPYTASFTTDENGVAEIMLQVANYLEPENGAISRSIRFGESSNVLSDNQISYSMQLIVFVAFIIFTIFSIGVYFINDRKGTYLLLSFLVFCVIVNYSLGSNEKLLTYWLQLDYKWNLRITNLATIGMIYSLWTFIKDSFTFPKIIHRIIITISIISIITVLFSPLVYLLDTMDYLSGILIISLVLIIGSLFKKSNIQREETIWILFALLALLNSYIWWGIWNDLEIYVFFYPIDLLLVIGFLVVMWFIMYFNMHNRTKDQALRLTRVGQEKDAFLARTSHELRNPLHSILNITEITLNRNKGIIDQKSIKDLENVIVVGNRLTYLLDDLFEMANLKITKPTIRKKAFYLQSIATGILDMFDSTIDKKNVTLKNEINDDLPPVFADENRVIQVIYNLIHNAVKFTDEGEITLSAQTNRSKQVIVTVKDTGIGMNSRAFDKMFQPYEQGENNINTTEGGLGLGLAVSKELIELHDEKIYGNSEEGIGSEVSFTLTIKHGENENFNRDQTSLTNLDKFYINKEHSISNNEESSTEKVANVLIIDDDPINLTVLQSLLSGENYKMVCVQHGRELLRKINAEQWDLIIMDVMMPNLSGYNLTTKVREQFSKTELPILLLTARNNPKDIVTGFQAGANDYLTKPVNGNELKERVRNLINIKKSTEIQLNLESKWLQAQIKPHFIFNTLNTINALSEIDTDEMRRLIDAFSDFLRSKFNFTAYDDLISVKDELSIVHSYTYIEKVRFGERLTVQWEIGNIEGFNIPPLTIQTIVENAVHHGVMQRIEGGVITIRVFQRGKHLRIVIKDNGVGMNKETVRSITETTETGGVGLANTNKRLKIKFQTNLQIKSIPMQGTVVAFNIYQDDLLEQSRMNERKEINEVYTR